MRMWENGADVQQKDICICRVCGGLGRMGDVLHMWPLSDKQKGNISHALDTCGKGELMTIINNAESMFIKTCVDWCESCEEKYNQAKAALMDSVCKEMEENDE